MCCVLFGVAACGRESGIAAGPEEADVCGPADCASDTRVEDVGWVDGEGQKPIADGAALDAATPSLPDVEEVQDMAGLEQDGVGISDSLSTNDGVEVPPSDWGEPIEALPGAWTWVDFSDSRCADGSPTGLAVNLHPGAERVLIYLEGGGACWDYGTCFGVIQTSFHLDGYDEGTFAGPLAAVYKESFLFDRDTEENPFADAHYVFIPYCTGDAFAGSHVTELEGVFSWEKETIHFLGHDNIKTYLKRLVPTFTEVERVYVAGASAGGFGAGLNWLTLQEAFVPIPVDVIDDSGPPVEPGEGRWEEWQAVWNISLPADCSDCAESLLALMNYFRETALSSGRLALLSYSYDPIISTFFGVLPSQFAELLDSLCGVFDEESNAQYFVIEGVLHTMIIVGIELIVAEDGTALIDWLRQMVEEDPGWESHGPGS